MTVSTAPKFQGDTTAFRRVTRCCKSFCLQLGTPPKKLQLPTSPEDPRIFMDACAGARAAAPLLKRSRAEEVRRNAPPFRQYRVSSVGVSGGACVLGVSFGAWVGGRGDGRIFGFLLFRCAGATWFLSLVVRHPSRCLRVPPHSMLLAPRWFSTVTASLVCSMLLACRRRMLLSSRQT
jgi:hypothetical protein